MSIEILNMHKFEDSESALDIAFPVYAYECEAAPPIDKYLDAYEEAVLKLISIGLGVSGIAKTLNCTEGLVESVIANLEGKRKFIKKEIGSPWKLTQGGQDYLDGNNTNKVSDQSEYGYMFVNAIRRNVFPFFYKGDIGKVSLFRGEELPLRLTTNGNENDTFEQVKIKRSKFIRAYKEFVKSDDIVIDFNEGNISVEEAKDLFEDLESFDEELDVESVEENTYLEAYDNKELEGLYIRTLKKSPKKFYLRMQIIIDPHTPGGFRVESPLPFSNIDENYFRQQIQWMRKAGTTFIEDDKLDDFMINEIQKRAPQYSVNEKDYSVYVLEKAPLLSVRKDRYSAIYDDLSRIYDQLLIQNSLLDKENIVNNLYKYVIEKLLNRYFKSFTKDQLYKIQQNAFAALKTDGEEKYINAIVAGTNISAKDFPWRGEKHLRLVLGRLIYTKGNSICEKMINVIVANYHFGSESMKRLLNRKDIDDLLKLFDRMNLIRRKVTHDTEEVFTTKDYEFFISHVYDLVNAMLESFEEER